MTVAGHDDGPEYGSGGDALLAAIMDEPLSGDARGDAAFMDEYRSAVADLTQLRAQLRGLGDALAAPAGRSSVPERTAPVPAVRAPARRTRRPFAIALGALAAVCAAAMFSGAVWLVGQSGAGAGDSSAADKSAAGASQEGSDQKNDGESMSAEGTVACARLIVEGTVERVEPLPGGAQDRIVLDVTRYYKPSSGKKRVTFTMDVAVDPRLRPGDHTLILIPSYDPHPTIWSTGKDVAKDRRWIIKALPGSRKIECEGDPGPGA
ncbi:hypothetical protein ACWD4J_21740 [Streptomyces sp. NPDC002577]